MSVDKVASETADGVKADRQQNAETSNRFILVL
jgi:hypothetical protein